MSEVILCVTEGEGVEYNVDIVKDWLGKACDNGNQNACDSYSNINQYGRL